MGARVRLMGQAETPRPPRRAGPTPLWSNLPGQVPIERYLARIEARLAAAHRTVMRLEPEPALFVHEQPGAQPKFCRVVEQTHLRRREAISRGLVLHGIDDADWRLAFRNVMKRLGWPRQAIRTVCRNEVLHFVFGRAGKLEAHLRSPLGCRASPTSHPSRPHRSDPT
jgi:hypothetical protein